MRKDHRSILYALALGDGCIVHRTGKSKNSLGYEYERNEYRLQVLHGPKQEAYCRYKAKLLTLALGGKQVNVTKVKNGPGGKYTAYRFSKNHNYFKQIRSVMYPCGKFTYTEKMLSMLDAHSIAIWYMDDGSARRNRNKEGVVTSVNSDIATCCSKREAELVIDWFLKEWGIVFKLRHDRKRNQYSVAANTEGSRDLVALICKYVPECMMYKLTHVSDMKLHERQTRETAKI